VVSGIGREVLNTYHTDALANGFPHDCFRVVQPKAYNVFSRFADAICDTNRGGGNKGYEGNLIWSVKQV
jgi:hypothetical protein